jgi:hypothetical protein
LALAQAGIVSRRVDARQVSKAWTDSGMQGGPVDELLGVAVECPALEQLEVEVGRTLEDRVQSGLTRDHRSERHLDAIDQAGGHQCPVQRQAAVPLAAPKPSRLEKTSKV